MKYLRLVILVAMIVPMASCTSCGGGGSGGGAPVVSSATDAESQNLSTVTTGIFPTAFTITFDQAMDATTITTANVVLTCTLPPSTEVPQPTTVITGSSATYVLAVTDAWKYQLLTCNITIGTGVKNASGTAMASAKSYDFTNACAVADDFNAESITGEASSCWAFVDNTFLGGYVSTFATWADFAATNIMSWDLSNSFVDFDFAAPNTEQKISFMKTVTVDDNFSMDVNIPEHTSFDKGGSGRQSMMIVTLLNSNGGVSSLFQLMLTSDGAPGSFCATAYSLAGPALGAYAGDCSGADTDYTIRLTRTGGVFTHKYKVGSGDFTDLTVATAGWADIDFSSGTTYMVLSALGYNPALGEIMKFGYVSTTGINVSGQY